MCVCFFLCFGLDYTDKALEVHESDLLQIVQIKNYLNLSMFGDTVEKLHVLRTPNPVFYSFFIYCLVYFSSEWFQLLLIFGIVNSIRLRFLADSFDFTRHIVYLVSVLILFSSHDIY